MRKWRYGKGIISENIHGTFSVYLSIGKGKGLRSTQKTISEAKNWIMSCGTSNGDLDAVKAREILPPEITLVEAAKFWQEQHSGQISISITDAYNAFISELGDNIRHRTMNGYTQVFNRLVSSFGNRSVSDITKDCITDLVNGLSPTARNNVLSRISPFLSFCVKEGWLKDNPCKHIRKAKKISTPPCAFTPTETECFLRLIEKEYPTVVPVFVLGFFAGLRPEEALRIRPNDIKNGYIILGADKTKTSSTRIVKIRPNLQSWLDKFPITEDPHPKIAQKARLRYVELGGKWTQDIARHSYATYAYEENKNAMATASEMGHTSTAIFFKHYRAMASEGSSKSYFNIYPLS